MNLWIRSTAKTNLLQARFLTIMEGKTFYKENEWEYKGYTICNVALDGNYELLGTYKTKERAIEVLDEIQNILKPKMIVNTYKVEQAKLCDGTQFIQPMLDDIQVQNATTYVYEMPKK